MEYDIKTMPNDIGLIRLYWKEKFPNDNLYAVRLYKKYNDIRARNSNPRPFLLEMNAKYPDAPDVLDWLALEYKKDHEYLKALQTFNKLIELYPAVDHYKKQIEACKMWIEADSMPESEETLEWIRIRIQDIWG